MDPITKFIDLFALATASLRAVPANASSAFPEVNAMTLATVDPDNKPSARIVLLKAADANGFTFFTNYEGRKAAALAKHPVAALVFHWPLIGVQVRIEGDVERVTAAESDAYFATRARGSQIGAWASDQSRALESRENLEASVREIETRFANSPIPRPEHWGGYRVVPRSIEFWSNRDSRLHEREVFSRPNPATPWSRSLLQP